MVNERWANETRLSDYVILEEIANGAVGCIYRASCRKNGLQVVLKERRRAEGDSRSGDVMREVQLLSKCEHPNIISFFGYFRHLGSLYIVLEWAKNGDLSSLIDKTKREKRFLSEGQIYDIFAPLCSAVAYLHSLGIVHRDLKCKNVFIMADSTIKLGDFGIGRQMSENTQQLQTMFGTPLYLSPELCKGLPYNEKTDVWSLGVILYELAALRHPFDGQSFLQLANNITKGIRAPLPSRYSDVFRSIVDAMLAMNPQKRPTMREVYRMIPTNKSTNRAKDAAADDNADREEGSNQREDNNNNNNRRNERERMRRNDEIFQEQLQRAEQADRERKTQAAVAAAQSRQEMLRKNNILAMVDGNDNANDDAIGFFGRRKRVGGPGSAGDVGRSTEYPHSRQQQQQQQQQHQNNDRNRNFYNNNNVNENDGKSPAISRRSGKPTAKLSNEDVWSPLGFVGKSNDENEEQQRNNAAAAAKMRAGAKIARLAGLRLDDDDEEGNNGNNVRAYGAAKKGNDIFGGGANNNNNNNQKPQQRVMVGLGGGVRIRSANAAAVKFTDDYDDEEEDERGKNRNGARDGAIPSRQQREVVDQRQQKEQMRPQRARAENEDSPGGRQRGVDNNNNNNNNDDDAIPIAGGRAAAVRRGGGAMAVIPILREERAARARGDTEGEEEAKERQQKQVIMEWNRKKAQNRRRLEEEEEEENEKQLENFVVMKKKVDPFFVRRRRVGDGELSETESEDEEEEEEKASKGSGMSVRDMRLQQRYEEWQARRSRPNSASTDRTKEENNAAAAVAALRKNRPQSAAPSRAGFASPLDNKKNDAQRMEWNIRNFSPSRENARGNNNGKEPIINNHRVRPMSSAGRVYNPITAGWT